MTVRDRWVVRTLFRDVYMMICELQDDIGLRAQRMALGMGGDIA